MKRIKRGNVPEKRPDSFAPMPQVDFQKLQKEWEKIWPTNFPQPPTVNPSWPFCYAHEYSMHQGPFQVLWPTNFPQPPTVNPSWPFCYAHEYSMHQGPFQVLTFPKTGAAS